MKKFYIVGLVTREGFNPTYRSFDNFSDACRFLLNRTGRAIVPTLRNGAEVLTLSEVVID